MTKHNYPAPVVEAVAKALMDNFGAVPWERSTERERTNERNKADIALSALWDSDQPSTISADEAREMWRLIIQVHGGDTESMHDLRRILAAHAPNWGTDAT